MEQNIKTLALNNRIYPKNHKSYIGVESGYRNPKLDPQNEACIFPNSTEIQICLPQLEKKGGNYQFENNII